MNAENN